MSQDVSQLRAHETMHKFNRHTTRENDTCCVQQIHTLRPTRRGQNATKIMLTASRVTVRRIQTQDPRFSAKREKKEKKKKGKKEKGKMRKTGKTVKTGKTWKALQTVKQENS